VKFHIQGQTASPQTRLCTAFITAAEQQTMNYYMNVAGFYPTAWGQKLYREIGMVEEQHVSHYGSLLDVNCAWLENLLMHQFIECYLYYSCMETETVAHIKQVWERLFEQELAHLHKVAELLYKEEHKDYQQVVGEGNFPSPLSLCSNIPYVRSILQGTVDLTACRESYARVGALEPETDFFRYQGHINHDVNSVSSHLVIDQHIRRFGEDYRFETAPNPISALRDRKQDNVDVGRKAVKREPAPVM
jgi:hypothetical protein